MKLRLLTIALLISGIWPALAAAEDTSERWGLGIDCGMMKLIGGDYDYSNLDQYITFQGRRGLTPNWSLELSLKYGWVRPGVRTPSEEARWSTSGENGLYTVIWQPRLGVRYLVMPERQLSPFAGLSLGWTSWSVKDLRTADGAGLSPDGPVLVGYDTDGNSKELNATNLTASLTLGAEYFFDQSWSLAFGTRWHALLGSDLDNIGFSGVLPAGGPVVVDANNSLVEGFVGMTYFFGPVDSDGDGIRDRQDACPNDGEDYDGFEDADGCPDRDNDQDDLADGDDRCPNDPEDYDGFADSDGCPDPDNDSDGVIDAIDRCPDEAEDVDAFEDEDGCPDPDNDQDGVPDLQDECPDTPGSSEVDENGCPVVTEEFADQLILEGVNFLSGSAELTASSATVLQEVAESLQAHPYVQIEIQGHTDNSGLAEANRELSYKRALAVRDALVRLGVDPARMVAVGFGQDFPIASNSSSEGRARNRRVEIHRIDR